MGKQRYTAAEVIEAIQKARGILAIAANRLGCSRETVVNYTKRYPTVQAAVEQEREKLIDLAEGKLIEKIMAGEWPAIKYSLTMLGKKRGYAKRTETVALNINLDDLTDDQLARIMAGEDPADVVGD